MISALLVVLPSLVVSCKVGPNYTTPPAKTAAQWSEPASLTNHAVTASAEDPEGAWWRYFHDPVLDELVAAARSNNLSLQEAGVRILEARARLNQSIGNLFPQDQGIKGGVNYERLHDGMASSIPGINPDYINDYALFAATWEIDFWGKYRRGIESDRASFYGTMAAYEDSLVTVTADVAASYVNIRTFEERLRSARRNVELQRESLRIARAQFNAGETSERDVQQATAQLGQTEAAIPLLVEARAQACNGLAVLLGETVPETQQRLQRTGNIPQGPTAIEMGIPHDLLRRRPDVRAAGYAAASKCALIGVARANMYPSFSLAGEFGFSGNNEGANSLVDMFTWQGRAAKAGANFFFPIFNYGRLENQVRVQDAQFQQAILNYQNTVLKAQQEVEDGLVAFREQQKAVDSYTEAAQAARRSTQLAMTEYKGGQTDYTTVLTAEQAQLVIEDDLATARGNVVLGLVSLYRALGGGWAVETGDDVVSQDVKTAMARRTNWGKLLEPARHLPPDTAQNQRTQ